MTAAGLMSATDVMRETGLSRPTAIALMRKLGGYQIGYKWTLPRPNWEAYIVRQKEEAQQ